MKRSLLALLMLLLTGGVAVYWLDPTDFDTVSTEMAVLEPALETEAERGAAIFAFGEFGTLSGEALQTSAAPWKIVVAALALEANKGRLDGLDQIDMTKEFQRFGFLTPHELANWPASLPRPDLHSPLGINVGAAKHDVLPIGLSLSNTGCAACHAGVTYDAAGQPDPGRVWLGMPNSSINLEGYVTALYSALQAGLEDQSKLLEAVRVLFPETGATERHSLRFLIMPILAREMAEREQSLGQLLPFTAGVPGATNGLHALQNRLGLIAEDQGLEVGIFNSVPDLGGRLFRRSFLNTASYVVPGQDALQPMQRDAISPEHMARLAAILAYFTVPSMGASERTAEAHIPDAVSILTWARGYEAQPFPGEVDEGLLATGRAVYASACSQCHGTYDDNLHAPALLSFPNWIGDIGTDAQRKDLTDAPLAEAVNAGRFGAYIDARPAPGYAAPPLEGIWASAPYLHNGSVPTLWHLMHPEARPERFMAGGHALDLEKIGIAGQDDGQGGWMTPPGYTPWSEPVLIDTTQFGLGHQGHEAEFTALSEAERRALLEYLKRL